MLFWSMNVPGVACPEWGEMTFIAPPWNFKEGLWWLSQVDLTHCEEPNVATLTRQAQKHAR